MKNFFFYIVHDRNSRVALLKEFNTLIIAIILTSFSLLLSKVYLFALGIILFIVLLMRYEKLFLLGSVIVSFIVFTRDLSEGIREVINIAGTIVLLYLLIEEYGISTNKLPIPPLLVVCFVGFTLVSLYIY